MTTNPLERAVIEAAREIADSDVYLGDQGRLRRAFEALDAAQDPAVTETPWSQVVEGDLLRSPKNGKFYEVESVRPEAHYFASFKVTRIKLAGIGDAIFRPRDGELTAFVKRGATGNAVDTFIDVFSSGGK